MEIFQNFLPYMLFTGAGMFIIPLVHLFVIARSPEAAEQMLKAVDGEALLYRIKFWDMGALCFIELLLATFDQAGSVYWLASSIALSLAVIYYYFRSNRDDRPAA